MELTQLKGLDETNLPFYPYVTTGGICGTRIACNVYGCR